ncbi:hypothetical protein F8271_29170 [Micromonospora sp. ALFpr18c]|uniref:hypothetical protein n=1 Tax=unclassified Micromonospora TaxID=2617518 RepID=UPI00124B2B90|nr:hypothetical protein [Micromonospora sp. ALFpr18c]KAB1928149.1 hypothetical protein F8271_29170 [Micromonospora sp. ALFpr18c]
MRFVDYGDGGISAGKPTSPSTSSSGTPSSAGPAAAPVLWKGEIRLDSTPRDFDQEPPARGNTSTDLNSDGYLNGSVYNKFWGRAVVLWPGPAEPTRDGCAARCRPTACSR